VTWRALLNAFTRANSRLPTRQKSVHLAPFLLQDRKAQ
jgi:hypothetical protein